MLSWAMLVAGTLIATEILLRLPLLAQVRGLDRTGRMTLRVIRSSRISDHWKEKVLLVYARRLATHSLTLFALLVAIASPLLLLAAAAAPFGIDFMALLLAPLGLIAMIVIGAGYLLVRPRLGLG